MNVVLDTENTGTIMIVMMCYNMAILLLPDMTGDCSPGDSSVHCILGAMPPNQPGTSVYCKGTNAQTGVNLRPPHLYAT